VDALERFNSDIVYRQLLQLSQRLEIFEERREEKILTTTFVAFEAIAAIFGAGKEGFTDEQIRGCFPVEWGDSTVEIPSALIRVLAEAWIATSIIITKYPWGKASASRPRARMHGK